MAKNLEIRALGNCEVREDAPGEFSGYVVTWGTNDSYNTSFKRGAFKKTISERAGKIKLLWNHDAKAMPIGSVLELVEDDTGLFFRAALALDTEKGREVYSLMKMGAINTMSFGFRTIKDGGYKKGVREITEVALYEISPVNFEANPTATINDVRATIFSQTIQDADLRVRGNRLMSALEETLWDIHWDIDAPDDRVRAADAAIGEFHTAFIEWMQEINERAEEVRGAPDANALAQAFNQFLDGRSAADFAAESHFTRDQVESLRRGKLIPGADLKGVSEDVVKAYEERQAEVAQALRAEIEALPEELRNQALEGFAVNVESKETPEPEPQHDERAQALQELLERVRASRKS